MKLKFLMSYGWCGLALCLTLSQTVQANIAYLAKLVPQAEQVLYAPFAGRVEEIWVQVGQDITEQAPILKLSTDEGESKWVELQQDVLRLEQKLKGFEMNQHNLEWVKLSNQQQKAKSEYDRAQKRDLDSTKLYKKGIISREEYERDAKSHQDAKLNLDETQITLKHFKVERSSAMKNIITTQYNLQKKRKDILERALKQSTLQAPIAGKIKSVSKNQEHLIRVGSAVQAGQALFMIEPQQNPLIEFNITEYELHHIQLGQSLKIITHEPSSNLDAQVISIESGESEQPHQPMPFKVKLKLNSGQQFPSDLRMGMSVKVQPPTVASP